MKLFWSLLLLQFLRSSSSQKICDFGKVNETSIKIRGVSPCEYEFEKTWPDACQINIAATGPEITISSQSQDIKLDNNSTKIPLKFTFTNLKFSSPNDSNFSVLLTQERCECESVDRSDYSQRLNGTERICLKIGKNSTSICQLQLRVQDEDCNGALEINGSTLITGCLSSTKRLDFLKENHIYLVLYGFKGKVKWKQTVCQNNTNHNLLNLLQLPVEQEGRRCSRVYDQEQFTLRSPFYGPGECIFRIFKSRPSICRLRLLFYWFDLGAGRYGRCEDGFLEVDGYTFCGCQSGLLWTTGMYTFRGSEAILRYVSRYPGSNMAIQVTQEDCFGPPRRFKRYINNEECRPYALPPPSYPEHIDDGGDKCNQETKCALITSKDGQISSVGYPGSIPGETCFKFSGVNCMTVFKFDDFDLPHSPECRYDYLLLSGRKYCGNSLNKVSVRLESDEVLIKSSGLGGRGFLASYTQICGEETTTTQSPDSDDSESSGREADSNCRKIYREKEFHINHSNPRGCVYTVQKYNKDVCGLEIEVSSLDITCGRETLHLDKQYYCGRIPKETFYLAFSGEEIVIEHEVSDLIVRGNGQFKIKGRQQNCAFNAEQTEERVSNCVTQLDGEKGVARAPSLFPRPPQDLDCAYQIFPLPGMCSLRLEFGQVDIGISEGCSRHYLKIGSKKYCGHSLSETSKVLEFPSEKTPLELRYRIGKDLPFLDWEFRYAQAPCSTNN